MPSQISLTKGQFALVDDADYHWLSQWRWLFSGNGYAMRTFTDENKNRRFIQMHRAIMKAQPGELVDHISGDRLNNTRSNLRIVDRHQNMWNRQRNSKGSSNFKGVSAHRNGWRVRIRYMNRRIHLGYFSDPVEAALMYDAAARHLFGDDYARLNFPDVAALPHLQEKLYAALARNDPLR